MFGNRGNGDTSPIRTRRKRRSSSDEEIDTSCQINVNILTNYHNISLKFVLQVDNSDKILNIIKTLYQEKQMCDVTLKVGPKEFQAHRLILCASSDVFQAMLTRPEWTEWHESRVELQELPQCETVFHLFLEYLYTGKILITHTNVMPVLALADKYIVRSLTNICTKYMCLHVPHASSHNQLFSWLLYTSVCGHDRVSECCRNFIKWNFESVANTADFSNFDVDMFIMILQQNDIVVYNELVLYNCLVRWLELQRIRLREDHSSESDDDFKVLVEMVMIHIRFPMIAPRELAGLILSPIIREYKEFFIDRMVLAMSYHEGNVQKDDKNAFLYTPRLYTADNCSAILTIDNFWSLSSYHTSTFVFSSHVSAAEHESNKINEWVVDLYPKGVWFQKCYLIAWQGTLEVPEQILSTVRLSLTCRELCEDNMRVKVSVLIYGSLGGVEHVMNVIERIHHFNINDKVMNVDDLIPFKELNPQTHFGQHETVYLVGPERNQLKINLIISPVR